MFFYLMHYCHLSKEEIWDLTLPQIDALLARVNRHIEFEVKLAGGEMEEEHEITDADLITLQSMPHIN